MKILVADDDVSCLKTLQNILEVKQHQVSAVSNGLSAVDRFVEESPDLVILDGSMPIMDGYEAAREIAARSDPDDPVPVLFVSGDTDRLAVARGMAAGAVDFLPKPVSVIQLLSKVRKIENSLARV